MSVRVLTVFQIFQTSELFFDGSIFQSSVITASKEGVNLWIVNGTADAANIDAVIIANPKSDLYNPNIIRSSVGCVFTNQIAMGSTLEIIQYLKDKN